MWTIRLITKAIVSQGIETRREKCQNKWRLKEPIPRCGDETVGIRRAVSVLIPVVQMYGRERVRTKSDSRC